MTFMYTAAEILLMIAAVGALIVNAINAWRNGTKLELISKDTAKIDVISQDAKVVLGHVNSKETKLTEQLTSKDKELEMLKIIIADKDKVAALLAQAVSTRTRATDVITESLPGPLVEIQKNTKDTVETLKEIKDR